MSLVLGVLALLTSPVPLLGVSLGMFGFLLGCLGVNSGYRGTAIAGLVLSCLAMLLSFSGAAGAFVFG